jgi:hypothetical protein
VAGTGNRTIEDTRKILSIQLDIQLGGKKVRLQKVAEAQELIAALALDAAKDILGEDAVEAVAVDWNYSYRWAEESEVLTPEMAA